MLSSWVASSRFRSKLELKSKDPSQVELFGQLFVLSSTERDVLKELIQKHALDWQKADLLQQTEERELFYFHSLKEGPFWVVCPKKKTEVSKGLLLTQTRSEFAWFRDTLGGLVSHFRAHRLSKLFVNFGSLQEKDPLACLLGFDMINQKSLKNLKRRPFFKLSQ